MADDDNPYAKFARPPVEDDNPYAKFAAPKVEMSQSEAALHGFRKGASANFSDEIYGLSEASGLPRWLGGFRAPVGAGRMLYEQYQAGKVGDTGSPFFQQYHEAVKQRRDEEKAAAEQYPGTVLAGQVAGSLLTPGATSVRAATLPARVASGAKFGAAYGAAAGAGEGENDIERLKGAGMGAVFGTATGAVAPAATELALTAGGTVIAPVASAVRGWSNPQREAQRLVGGAIGRDIATDAAARTRLTPQEFSASVSQGGPAILGDLGGESTRALARAASNVSPEARQIIDAAVDPRFETQSNRIADWGRQTFNHPNVYQQEQALAQAAHATNNPAYRRAYTAGAGSVGSPELERLASSDAVAKAMKTAASKAGDEEVISGYGAMNPRVTFTPSGSVVFQRSPSGMPTYPDLQFWDLTRRELSAAAKVAQRQGNDTEARRLGELARRMNAELDQVVPEYGQARQGAARFFGSENALEAGQNFFGQGRRMGLDEARTAMQRMSPVERQLFQDAYAARFLNAVESPGARRNVLTAVPHLTDSPALNAEMQLAMGPANFADLGRVRRTENIMDRMRQATQGNSTTARQLAERALFTTSGGIGGYGVYNQDPRQATIGALAAALVAGGRHVNQNVMRNAAQILTSQAPEQLGRIAPQATLQQATEQALAAAQRRSQISEQRSALARSLIARGIIGGAIPLEK